MKKLVIIEGIDCSGKTSVAKAVAKNIGFKFEHEPTFSSQYADSLNFKKMNAYQREFYFLIDRYKHQDILNSNDVIIDRYRLTGAVYSLVYGPEALPMVHGIYGLPEFKKPDLTIFLDMPPSGALKLNDLKKGTEEYSPELTMDKLNRLRDGFLNQISVVVPLWDEKVITIETSFGKYKEVVEAVTEAIKKNVGVPPV